MEENQGVWESLCYVEATEGFGIRRLADLDVNDLFYKVETKSSFRLYNNGSFNVGFVGLIRWRVEPSKSDPSKKRHFLEISDEPTLVQPTEARDVDEIKAALKKGIRVDAQGSFKVLFVPKYFQNLGRNATCSGLLCGQDDCERSTDGDDALWTLKPQTLYLSEYTIVPNDTFRVEGDKGRELIFYQKLNWPQPDRQAVVRRTEEIALELLKERWENEIKNAKEFNRDAKRKVKEFLREAVEPIALLEELQAIGRCSREEAEVALTQASRCVDDWFGDSGKDLKTLVELLEGNDELRERYYAFWLERFEEELEKEEEEARKRQQVAEEQAKKINAEIRRLEKERALLNDEKKRLNVEIAELGEERKRREEELRQANDLLEKAFERRAVGDGASRSSSLFTPGSAFRPLETDKIDKFPTAKILEKNLKRRVVSDYNEELAAFVLAAFSRRQALILAGPCGERIGEALAAACGGRRPGTLRCDGDWNEEAVAQAANGADETILAKNALNPRWGDRWPDAIAESPKQWILTTPFAEDLTLLPISFYNYFAPVLTDLLLDGVNWDGKPWIAGKSVPIDRSNEKIKGVDFDFDGEPFAKMQASAFYCKRLEATLTSAYQIGRETLKFDEASQTRLTLLFGVAPLAFATGNLDVLRETFDWEKENLDDKCRETIRRLLGDAEE